MKKLKKGKQSHWDLDESFLQEMTIFDEESHREKPTKYNVQVSNPQIKIFYLLNF